MNAAAACVLGSYVPQPPKLGAPDVCGPLSIFPLLGTSASVRFRVLSPTTAAEVLIRELPAGAAVNRLLVDNHSDVPVLLYEGQELVGARQNRVVERAVVVPPHAALEVAVLCIEEKRWDGGRTAEAFSVGSRVAHASFRTTMSGSRSRGSDARETQVLAWTHVRERVSSHRTPTRTMSLSDVFEGRRDLIVGIAERFPLRPGQIGTLAAIRGRFVSLDLVASPEEWCAVHRSVVMGYAFDAIDVLSEEAQTPSLSDASAAMAGVLGCPVRGTSSAGMGLRLHATEAGLDATATTLGGTVVQLAAHFQHDEGA